MGSRTTSPPSEPLSPVDGGIRKRVCKACDRCRLKKSKCDGTSPCNRCKADNAICVFSERKKSYNKVYPKGYVEMLENQETQLVQGLQELYSRVNNGEGWTGAPLREINGLPLIYDILDRLGALKHDGQAHVAQFEEDFLTLQRRMIAEGAGYMQRGMSFDTKFEADQPPLFDPSAYHKPAFVKSFSSQFPPTPPMDRPLLSPVKTSSPLKTYTYTSTPQLTQQVPWQAEPLELEGLDLNFANKPSFFNTNMQNMPLAPQMPAQMFQQSTNMAINPCMTMKNWPGMDDNMQQYC
ncbi:Fluconazole resistance protein 1 [Exophiala xenobiotica]|uniref:Fluconazole resistance protein 1 n=1 Tax=Lithohypha guttulata TaxID=1690604 RepID=A0ABR0JTU5_9EURO|nr:Fluconazole resistance protein 1 [Lithohypha guttulata]KAK5313089.1 Fluconazole resistance protein 1 [Exophiala xenobiotica]